MVPHANSLALLSISLLESSIYPQTEVVCVHAHAYLHACMVII